MEHIVETVLSSAYIDLTNTKIIIPMMALTSGLMVYRNTYANKFKFVCALAVAVAACLTLWTYLFFAIPAEAKTALVGLFVFVLNFLTAMVWGWATWIVYRYSYMRKLARQTAHEADGA